MIIYKDLVSGAEVLTDSYPCVELFDGVLYEVTGKLTTETTDIDDSLIGGNASAEAEPGEGGAESSSKSGINIVFANKLEDVDMTKKEFKTWLKNYSIGIKARLAGNPRLETFVKNGTDAAKKLLSIFDDCQIFVGENCVSQQFDKPPEGPCAIVLALYEQDGKTVKMYYWRDGLEEEKA
ncbi:translationally-controlled tumor protein-like [Halichondria panicea]|uniref:translationally-controlled tumor protein-like n=1 Tax=Halichondria panicea TaxID=6063 RepID=UPI00312BB686